MTCLVLGGLGIFGNAFVIVLAVKYTVTKRLHFLIINMAVADTLVVVINIYNFVIFRFLTHSVWNDLHETIAQTLCKALSCLYYVCPTESLVTLLIISIERYRITRQTCQVSRPVSGKQRVTVVVLCWLMAFLIHSYLFFSAQVKEKSDSELVCVLISVENVTIWRVTFFIALHVVLFNFLSILVLSILTLRRISKPQAVENSLSEVQRQQWRKRIRNAVKLVLYSILLFFCCYTPFVFSLVFGRFFIQYCIDWSMLFFFTWYFLPLVNSCLSPLIYCVCLSDFREAARRLLCGKSVSTNFKQRNCVAQ